MVDDKEAGWPTGQVTLALLGTKVLSQSEMQMGGC